MTEDSRDRGDVVDERAPVESLAANRLNDVRYVHAGDWDDRLQDEVDDAAAAGERYLVVHGAGTFEPRTTVSLPDDFTLRIDDNVRLVPPADHDLAEVPVGGRTYRTLVTNADHEAGNENVAIEGGYVSFENVDWDGLSHAPVWFHNCVDPLQEDVTVEDVAYDHASEDGTRQFGVFISESEAGVQKDCVARRVGYDGIANRGYTPNRTGKMIGCEAYDIPGTGIQFAGNVRGGGDRTSDQHLQSFVVRDCKTDAYITIHSGGDGITDGIIANNEALAISIIADGSFDNVAIRDNVTDSQLVAIRDEIRNLAIRGQQSRTGEGSSIRLIGYGVEGSLERLTIEGCFSRDRTFLKYDRAEGVAVDHVRLVDNVFDPDHDDATFVDGGAGRDEDGGDDLRRLDLVSNTVHDATVVSEGVDTARLRDNQLIGVDDVVEGDVPRVLRNGRGANDGDPAADGEWHGHADFAGESNAIVRDRATDDWYRAVDGEWVPA